MNISEIVRNSKTYAQHLTKFSQHLRPLRQFYEIALKIGKRKGEKVFEIRKHLK